MTFPNWGYAPSSTVTYGYTLTSSLLSLWINIETCGERYTIECCCYGYAGLGRGATGTFWVTGGQ